VAQKVDGPVKVIWSREEDIQHDAYRPMYYDRLAASLTDGRINGWHHRITGSSIMARWLPPAFQKGVDIDAVDSAVDIPYDIPNLRIEYVRSEPPAVPTGFWRGVGPNNNVFAIESFFDELAAASHKDPLAFRRDLLHGQPRLRCRNAPGSAAGAASRRRSPLPASSPPSPRSRSAATVRFGYGASSARWIPASRSIRMA
jgi:isoquinoline 1-oxidoreductase beta subunit